MEASQEDSTTPSSYPSPKNKSKKVVDIYHTHLYNIGITKENEP